MKLRDILVAEGAARKTDDLTSDVIEALDEIGYRAGLTLVINLYKPAASKRRVVGGVNEEVDSLMMFSQFAKTSWEFASNLSLKPVVRALLLHNSASSLSKSNGNRSGDQAHNNRQAMNVLDLVDASQRDDDWWVVYEKVYVGLVEAGHAPYVEANYRTVLESMVTNGSKDAAGRRCFLARKLVEHGRFIDAREVLAPIVADTTSAPNQVQQATSLLAEVEAVLKNF